MAEPINFTPSAPISFATDEVAECHAGQPEPAKAAGAEGRGAQSLVEQYAAGGAGSAAPSPASEKSCLAPLLSTIGACGAIALTEGTAALLAGSQCAGSAVALWDCVADPKTSHKP
jgi:hypothetical protein